MNSSSSIGTSSFAIDTATNRINGFSYDPAGNMTGDGAFSYAYDGANRMKQAQQVASPNTTTTSTYFGALQIKKALGSSTTVYIYSGTKPVAEYLNGSLTKEYVYNGSVLLATISGSSTTYHHPDHLSSRSETDASGTPTRSFGHFSYGEVWYESSSDTMKFTNYTRDAGNGEPGLDYAMFRYYNPTSARFMSADLLGGDLNAPQSLNKMAYVVSDPINLIDPLGLVHSNICLDTRPGPNRGNPILCSQLHMELLDASNFDWMMRMLAEFGGFRRDNHSVKPWDFRERLYKLLKGKNDCADWFNKGTGGSAPEIIGKVPITLYESKQSVLPPEDAQTTSDPSTPIEVNNNGRFYADADNQLPVGGVYPAGSPGARMVILLHEVSHKVKPPGIVSDILSPADSDKNTLKVIQNCEKAIDDILK